MASCIIRVTTRRDEMRLLKYKIMLVVAPVAAAAAAAAVVSYFIKT